MVEYPIYWELSKAIPFGPVNRYEIPEKTDREREEDRIDYMMGSPEYEEIPDTEEEAQTLVQSMLWARYMYKAKTDYERRFWRGVFHE